MHLVAHGEAARHQRRELQAARGAQRGAQQRPEVVAQPGEAREHLGVVGAEAHHLAQALVDHAVGPVAESAVLADQHRHRARRNAGHRPHRPVAVVGMEADGARGGQRRGRGEIRRPALEDEGARHCAAHRAAHAPPLDGRTGVQDHALLQLGHRLAGRQHANQHRIRGQHALQAFRVGPRDARLVAAQPGDELPGARAAGRVFPARRAPVDVRDRDAARRQVGREAAQADIDNTRSAREEARPG